MQAIGLHARGSVREVEVVGALDHVADREVAVLIRAAHVAVSCSSHRQISAGELRETGSEEETLLTIVTVARHVAPGWMREKNTSAFTP